MDIVKAFVDMALLGSAWVLWLLVILSIVSIAIIFERIAYYMKIRLDFAAFNREFGKSLIDHKVEDAERMSRGQAALEARVAAVGFEYKSKGVRAMEEAMTSYITSERQQLDRGLVVLGTLGNNAPFIGLFGTVLGIIQAFHELGLNPAGGPSVVMAGISEALVATAVGLVVAIPAVIAFNAFNRIVKRHLQNSESLMKLMLSHFS